MEEKYCWILDLRVGSERRILRIDLPCWDSDSDFEGLCDGPAEWIEAVVKRVLEEALDEAAQKGLLQQPKPISRFMDAIVARLLKEGFTKELTGCPKHPVSEVVEVEIPDRLVVETTDLFGEKFAKLAD